MEKKTKTVKEKKARAPKKAVIEEVSAEFSDEEEAKKNALKGAATAAVSQASMFYSKELLKTGDASTAWTNTSAAANTMCSDLKLTGFSPVPTCTGNTTVANTIEFVLAQGTDVTASGVFSRPN